VRFGHPRPSALIARKLLDTRMVTIAAPAYLKRYGHPQDPHELEKGHHVCIQFRDPETGRPYPWEFHKRRKKLVLTKAAIEALDLTNVYGVGHSAGATDLLLAAAQLPTRLVECFQTGPTSAFRCMRCTRHAIIFLRRRARSWTSSSRCCNRRRL
jgi:DNA-binding transcriptional LysR family regulator